MTKQEMKNQNMFRNFEDAYEAMKEEVGKALSTSPHIVREYTNYLNKTTGKLIRGFSLLTCALNEDDLIHDDACKLAASIELIHLATLVHDDIIDNADTRRGQMSLQKKYGKRTAVICGDYLLCMALEMAASVKNREEYLKEDYINLNLYEYMSKVCLGELNQHINNGNFDLTVYRYLKIISGKTAALFEASFLAGNILCEKDLSVNKKFAKLGRYIGMIFQLTDDCMDFETTEDVAKKPVQSDYEQNVITLPLVHAFRELKSLKKKAKMGLLTREEINDAVRKTGGLKYTRYVAKKYYNKALAIIDELELTDNKRDKLIEILNKSYREF
jgi:heptaprenyl diphosphate synthase